MVEPALQRLIDENEVKNLLIRLAYAIDECDVEKCRAVLADEVYCDFDPLGGAQVPPGPLSGDLIATETMRRNRYFQMTQHVNTMHLAEIDGDEATLKGYVIGSHFLGPSEAPDYRPQDPWTTLGARYEMRAQRFADGWRFTGWVWRLMWSRDNHGVWDEIRRRMKAQAKRP